MSEQAHRCYDNWLEQENEAEVRHDTDHLAVVRNTIAREREELMEEVVQRREWYRKRRQTFMADGLDTKSGASSPPYSDPRWDVSPIRDEYEVHTPSTLNEADLNAEYELRKETSEDMCVEIHCQMWTWYDLEREAEARGNLEYMAVVRRTPRSI